MGGAWSWAPWVAVVALVCAGCGGQAFQGGSDAAPARDGAAGSTGVRDGPSIPEAGLWESGLCNPDELWCPDCFGSGFCSAAACPDLVCVAKDATPQPTALRCPLAGDHLVYLSNDTSVGVTFENQSDHRIYICPSLGYDNANDTFNCQSAVVGLQVVVVSTGLAGTVQCTAGAGTTFGNVGIGLVGGAQACTYLNCRFGN